MRSSEFCFWCIANQIWLRTTDLDRGDIPKLQTRFMMMTIQSLDSGIDCAIGNCCEIGYTLKQFSSVNVFYVNIS